MDFLNIIILAANVTLFFFSVKLDRKLRRLEVEVLEPDEDNDLNRVYPYTGTHISVTCRAVSALELDVRGKSDDTLRLYQSPYNGQYVESFHRDSIVGVSWSDIFQDKENAEQGYTEDVEVLWHNAYVLTYRTGRGEFVHVEIATAHDAERLSYFMATGTVTKPKWSWSENDV